MYFLGLTEARTARRIVAHDAARLRFAAADGLAAICATPQAASPFGGRAHPWERRLDLQRLIEVAAAEGPFVAAAPGAEAQGPVEALDALGDDLSPFAETLSRFGLSREHKIGVCWDGRATLRAFAERDAPELALARAMGRDRFGETIAWAMANERRRLSEWVRAKLMAAANDVLTLPNRDDDQILNAVAMIGAGQKGLLDETMASIAAALPGRPRICCVGPLPASSFVVIDLVRVGSRLLACARERRGVDSAVSVRMARARA